MSVLNSWLLVFGVMTGGYITVLALVSAFIKFNLRDNRKPMATYRTK